MLDAADFLNAGILIVDDQEASADGLAQLLRAEGYVNVMISTDPHWVRELHLQHQYSLILLDLVMPGKTGFDVMQELRILESDGYLSVFAVTGHAALKLPALKAGAKDFIAKPFNADEILIRIHNLLEVRLLHNAAQRAAEQLQIMALHDPLTGLANRRLLTDRVSAAISNAKRSASNMAVVYLDLDGFKEINDTHGHLAGDTVLKTVAQRLLASVRNEDTVARLGGDEFMIALWHVTGEQDASTVASKVISLMAQPYTVAARDLTITISGGVALYPDHGTDTESLIKCADSALYAAKHAGKSTFRLAQAVVPLEKEHRIHRRKGGPATQSPIA